LIDTTFNEFLKSKNIDVFDKDGSATQVPFLEFVKSTCKSIEIYRSNTVSESGNGRFTTLNRTTGIRTNTSDKMAAAFELQRSYQTADMLEDKLNRSLEKYREEYELLSKQRRNRITR